MDHRGIVRDSSIWSSPETTAAVYRVDGLIRVGIVKGVFNDTDTGELRYLVGVNSNGREIDTNCRMLRRFGGVYNYEDYIGHGYNIQDNPDAIAGYNARAGDAVLVGQLNGQGREGVILGGLNHAARKTTIQASAGPQYESEFNGINTSINTNGEWTLTFKGQPTNLSLLNDVPSGPIAPPVYDLTIGGSYMKFDSTGSWTVTDAAQSSPQSIVINKATRSTTMRSSKIAIGDNGVELLDQITQALGDIITFLNNTDATHTHIGNLGYPTSPPQTAEMFTQLASSLQTIQGAINSIKGSL